MSYNVIWRFPKIKDYPLPGYPLPLPMIFHGIFHGIFPVLNIPRLVKHLQRPCAAR